MSSDNGIESIPNYIMTNKTIVEVRGLGIYRSNSPNSNPTVKKPQIQIRLGSLRPRIRNRTYGLDPGPTLKSIHPQSLSFDIAF